MAKKAKKFSFDLNPRTEGLFSRKAKARGKTVQAYAVEVIKKYRGKTTSPEQVKLLRQAVFARNAKTRFRKK